MKGLLAGFLTVILVVCMCPITACAISEVQLPMTGVVYDEDEDDVSSDFSIVDGRVTADPVRPGKTYYFEIKDSGTVTFGNYAPIPVTYLFETNDFSFKLDRDEGSKYLDTVKYVERNISGGRRPYIQVDTEESSRLLDDDKLSFDVFFKAKRSGSGWNSGDIANVRFELWLQNDQETTDAYIDTGDGVVFNPDSNEDNLITWGWNEDIASLEFEADSDADKFYAKLSTKAIRDVWENYGDPVDAELYFRSFVGNPQIDSTSRATLTLYDPFYEDGRWRSISPYDCYIYVYSGGELVDVTDRFQYVDGYNTDAGLPGWQARVRALGTYVISDTELLYQEDVWIDASSSASEPEAICPPNPTPTPPSYPTTPAPTGSKDFVAAAVGAAVLSLGVFLKLRKRVK